MKVNSKNRGFVEGTLVLMADGKEKAIEQIKTGDMVLSFDEYDADAPLEAMKVINTFSRIDNDILEVKVGENTLKVAKDQMFIGPHNDWKEVYNHSSIVDVNGYSKEYEVNKVGRGKYRVYDITVDENHSLIANGLRVHNVAPPGGYSERSAAGQAASRQGGNISKVGGGGGPRDSNNAGARSPETKTTNTRGTNTTKDAKTPNSNAGRTSTQSSNNSMGSGGGMSNANGGRGQGGQNSGVNSSNQKVNNGQIGFKKKPKKSKEEPTPTKPSGASVAIKLMETVDNNVDVLQGLINAYTPSQLTSTKPNIQAGVDSIYSFTNTCVGAIYASELNVYDKTELIQIATQIMSTTIELRNPFEETVVTAEGKKIAIIYLDLIEANVMLILEKLGAVLVNDGRGGLSVTVNGEPTSARNNQSYTKNSHSKARKESNGKYTSAKKKANRKVRTNTSSSAPARNIYEV